MTVLDSALNFASRGFPVFPVHKKNPQLKEWPDRATTDANQIRTWFDGKYKYCDGFGVCPGTSCFVIDIDVKEGKHGKESLETLRQNFGLDIRTLAVKTKNNGLHLYYKYPSIPDSQYVMSVANWMKLDGIDIRGNRGFVVGPTNSNGYKLIQDIGLLEVGPLTEKLPIGNIVKERVNTQSAESLINDEEVSSLRGKIPESIGQGERHDTLIRLMASWARKIPYDNAVILLEVAISRCEGGDIRMEDYLPRLDQAYAKFEPMIEDKLDWMLDNLVLISSGPRVYDRSKPSNIATLRLGESRVSFSNWMIWEEKADGSQKPVPAFDRWLKHTDRKMSGFVGYKPVKDETYYDTVLGTDVINSYRGPDHRIIENPVDIDPFIEFMTYLLEEDAMMMIDWISWLVQNPDKKMTWAPVLVSTHEGLGKNFLFNIISHLVGFWNTKNVSAGVFNKTFNVFLSSSVLILINELEEIDARKRFEIVSKLKSYITESTQTIEPKGVDPYSAEIFANFILFSNREDALHIKDDSRRFFVHINHQNPRPEAYYGKLHRWLVGGGYDAIYNLMATRDLSNFNPQGRAPHTESMELMVDAGRSNEEGSILEAIENRYSVFASDIVTKDSVEFFLRAHVHRGGQVSGGHLKQLMRHMFQSLRTRGSRRGRQGNVPKIAEGSDSNVIIEGKPLKQVLYTCRNHGSYDDGDIAEIQMEYRKIFDANKDETALRVVN
ncbi:MAG: bifunctional DNA primase/polymerase [Acidimicrobiia bacterium]|nr:bifunctional DNA primase/polymerase [Acidimicrobiia bacterium]